MMHNAKLPHCKATSCGPIAAHGLRKAGAAPAVENGATVHQLMA
jgi:hypothetical protein